jgi:hypothetical protein
MKSTIRTFVLAAFAAATILATAHSASAQMAFASTATTTTKTLAQNSRGTLMALILPNAGTYSLVGQQILDEAPGYASQTPVLCYTTNQAGGSTSLPYGPYSMATIPAEQGGYVTLPLNGYYTTTAPTEIWVECMYWGGASVAALTGTITATQVK